MHCKSRLLPVMEGLGYRYQAELQEGVGKGGKGLTPNAYSAEVFPAFDFF